LVLQPCGLLPTSLSRLGYCCSCFWHPPLCSDVSELGSMAEVRGCSCTAQETPWVPLWGPCPNSCTPLASPTETSWTGTAVMMDAPHASSHGWRIPFPLRSCSAQQLFSPGFWSVLCGLPESKRLGEMTGQCKTDSIVWWNFFMLVNEPSSPSVHIRDVKQ